MKGVLVCKTCLITNVKMFHLDVLVNAYSELTGLECDGATTEYVCYECAALLLKFKQFRAKCLKANQLILEFVGKHCKITENVLNAIDRKLHNLESTINKFEIKENVINELYNESKFEKHVNERPEQSIMIEIDEIVVASEIKDEEVELCDDKEQVVSDENESLHLKDDISFSDDCSLKLDDDLKDVEKKQSDDESIEIKKEIKSNNIEQESVEESKSSSKLQKNSRQVFGKRELEEYVTIVNLTPEQAKADVMLRMESSNYKTSRYRCDLCYRGFLTHITYENHMKKHNKEIGEHKCDYCHVRFTKRINLSKHKHSNHTVKINCKRCPYVCFDIHRAKVHMNLHKGKKYPCQDCGQIFNMPHSLVTHQGLKHSSCEYVCALCGSIFGKERGLKLHINILHKQDTNDQNGPLCEECDVHFATEAAWKRHLVLSSKHTVSNGCEVCGETYESEDALKTHAKVHSRTFNPTTYEETSEIKRTINCNICVKMFTGKAKYVAHMRTVHPGMVRNTNNTNVRDYVQCEICGKMCKSQSFYFYHQKIHRSERPYSCAECGKSFKLQTLLKTHLLSHSSVRAYKCHKCPKTFVYRSAYDKHLKVHLGIRPYKCNICDKSFPTPCEVKYHTQYVHQKVPWPKRNRSKRKKSARDSSPDTS